jgi:hypothetical protein
MRCLDITHRKVHRHVTSVVTRPGRGTYESNWTAAEVTDAIDHGHRFYTVSDTTGKVAEIESFTCPICDQEWITTSEHALADNRLESLPPADGDPGAGGGQARLATGSGSDGRSPLGAHSSALIA